MLEYLIDNIFLEFGGRISQPTIGIPMETNCDPFLHDFYKTEFIHELIIDTEQMPGWDSAHLQDNVKPHILRMFEGTLLLDA